MKIESMKLAWVSIKDFERSKKFFTQTLGLTLTNVADQWGWMELTGDGSFFLGAGTCDDRNPVQPGNNAVVTMEVKDLAAACAELKQKGVTVMGDIIEVPGEVKLAFIQDPDNNHYQLVERIKQEPKPMVAGNGAIKNMGMAWLATADVARSQKFFKDMLGLELMSYSAEWGWTEYKTGNPSFALGVCGCETLPKQPGNQMACIKAGSNAVLTMTVDDIVASHAKLVAQGVQFVGDMVEVPGHVKMHMFLDPDGNKFQLVQMLGHKLS